MSRMIFVNLPVADLERSKAFYEGIGFRNEPKFSNEAAAMMVLSDTISVMLLTHPFYATFTRKPIADANNSSQVMLAKKIADAKTTSQVLLCLSADSRGEVDSIVGKAEAAGGIADPGPKDESDFMYGRSFEDPDGHHWEPMWMNPQFAEQGAHPAEQADA